jgi:L-2-hydroxyglutarate oxidase
MAWAREGYRKRNINLSEALGNFAYLGFWRMALKTWKVGLGEVHRSFLKGVFVKDLQRLVPEIRSRDIVPGGAGVRAQAVSRDGRLLDDFSIEEAQGAIHVLNAPSPGATSSLSIGAHIADLAGKSFGLGG